MYKRKQVSSTIEQGCVSEVTPQNIKSVSARSRPSMSYTSVEASGARSEVDSQDLRRAQVVFLAKGIKKSRQRRAAVTVAS